MAGKQYEKYEKDCESIQASNEKLLKKFEDYLREIDLSPKTIRNHLDNINFYINEFLLYYDAKLPQEGILEVASFLGDWFPRKAMRANPSSVRNYIASFKKFYSWMVDQKLNTSGDLEEMKEWIKEEKDDWIEEVKYDEEDSNYFF